MNKVQTIDTDVYLVRQPLNGAHHWQVVVESLPEINMDGIVDDDPDAMNFFDELEGRATNLRWLILTLKLRHNACATCSTQTSCVIATAHSRICGATLHV